MWNFILKCTRVTTPELYRPALRHFRPLHRQFTSQPASSRLKDADSNFRLLQQLSVLHHPFVVLRSEGTSSVRRRKRKRKRRRWRRSRGHAGPPLSKFLSAETSAWKKMIDAHQTLFAQDRRIEDQRNGSDTLAGQVRDKQTQCALHSHLTPVDHVKRDAGTHN